MTTPSGTVEPHRKSSAGRHRFGIGYQRVIDLHPADTNEPPADRPPRPRGIDDAGRNLGHSRYRPNIRPSSTGIPWRFPAARRIRPFRVCAAALRGSAFRLAGDKLLVAIVECPQSKHLCKTRTTPALWRLRAGAQPVGLKRLAYGAGAGDSRGHRGSQPKCQDPPRRDEAWPSGADLLRYEIAGRRLWMFGS
jgi:hypothetical protein